MSQRDPAGESSASKGASGGEVRYLRCSVTQGFRDWMSTAGGSAVLTTYQAGRVVFAGWTGRQVSVLPREFSRPMGLAVRGAELVVACREEITFLANARVLAMHYPNENDRKYDALYLPRATFFTGDLYVHDVGYADDGLWMVNTRFSCLGRLSREYSFLPEWRPPFVSELAPEDRCHLNGLAVVDGRPKYVTALGRTDEAGGWRENRRTGGILMDIDSGEVVVDGLCMPHSPRWHDGKLWVLNSGEGQLCTVEPSNGERTVVAEVPGYLRGLCFVGGHALVGTSQVRSSHTFDGLPIQEKHEELFCGAALVDLAAGKEVGRFEFTEGCDEMFDVAFLPEVQRPNILNIANPATRQAVTTPELSAWVKRVPKDAKSPSGAKKG